MIIFEIFNPVEHNVKNDVTDALAVIIENGALKANADLYKVSKYGDVLFAISEEKLAECSDFFAGYVAINSKNFKTCVFTGATSITARMTKYRGEESVGKVLECTPCHIFPDAWCDKIGAAYKAEGTMAACRLVADTLKFD